LIVPVLGAALGAVEPLALKALFDRLAPGALIGDLFIPLAIIVAVALGREILAALANWLTWRARIGIHHALLEATIGKLHSLPLTFHKGESVGGLLTKLDRGIQGLVGALNDIAFSV